MGTTTHDIRLLSNDDLELYITNLKVKHDSVLIKLQDMSNPVIFSSQLRSLEEELCWAERELTNRLERKKYT